jgi:hypothetical protein
MPETRWQELYKAALLESDPERVNDRVKNARGAVYQRLMEDEPITPEEREKLNDVRSAETLFAYRWKRKRINKERALVAFAMQARGKTLFRACRSMGL